MTEVVKRMPDLEWVVGELELASDNRPDEVFKFTVREREDGSWDCELSLDYEWEGLAWRHALSPSDVRRLMALLKTVT